MAGFSSKNYGGGGSFITTEELTEMIETGEVVSVVGVREEENGKYGPRFILDLLRLDPVSGEEEKKSKGFPKGTVESRDTKLADLKAYLEDGGEPWAAKFTLTVTNSGNTMKDIVDAEEDGES